jgi:hypothetical protein
MPDNTTTIQSFLNVFATPIASGNVTTAITNVMALFSPNSPSVGIGGNLQGLGPVFTGTGQITALFTELLSSFPGLTFTAQPNPPVFCFAPPNLNLIMIQAQLFTGDHVKQWFPPYAGPQRRYYSKPLSDIVPTPNQPNHSYVPVCAVFTFDPQNPIVANQQYTILNLALYLDRWQFAADLWAPGHYPFPYPIKKADLT